MLFVRSLEAQNSGKAAELTAREADFNQVLLHSDWKALEQIEADDLASVAMGIGVFPTARLKFAADLDWTEWSHADKFVTTAQSGGSTIILGQRNTLDVRGGTEVEVSRAWAVRGGFSWLPRSLPMRSVLPSKPDADGFTIDTGFGWTSA